MEYYYGRGYIKINHLYDKPDKEKFMNPLLKPFHEMSEKDYIIYKMDSFGILHEVASDSLIDLFNLEEIIVVYSFKKITLYIWEGSDAPEELKSKVPKIKPNYFLF